MENKFLTLPFTRFDTPYLETLTDEVFFANRFTMSEEDRVLLLKNSTIIDGRRFYKAKILNALLEKYAAMTNPKEGEPGSKSKPLVRFGKKYVYNTRGRLVIYVGKPIVASSFSVNTLNETGLVFRRNVIRPAVRGKRNAGITTSPFQRGKWPGNHYHGWVPVLRRCFDKSYKYNADETFMHREHEKCKVLVKV